MKHCDQEIAQVGRFLLACKCTASQVIIMQEKDPLGDLHVAGVFPSKCPSIPPAEM